MSTDNKHVPPTSKIDVASGPAASGPKADQLPPSERSDVHGSAPSKPRPTKRRARRNDLFAAQRDDGAARRPKWKRPNAQKAGLYASTAFIPGEDPREFDQILAELIDFWQPAGPDLRDALRDLAEMKFHKRRLNRYVQTELYLYTFDPHHPAFNEVWGFCMFIHHLNAEPESCFDTHAKKYLRPAKINDLKQKFPRTNYPSTAEWVKAVMGEILSTPDQPRIEAAELGYSADALEQAAREWKTEQQMAGSITYSRETLEFEAKETERLNALIIKQTRYCAELKLWEESRDKT